MILHIDTTSSTPVYAQIVEQIKRAIASGTLKPGDALPSLRELAVSMRVNPLTVTKAYKQLEGEGLLETSHGRGSFVAQAAGQVAGVLRRESFEQALDGVLLDALNLGLSPEDIQRLIEERLRVLCDGKR